MQSERVVYILFYNIVDVEHANIEEWLATLNDCAPNAPLLLAPVWVFTYFQY